MAADADAGFQVLKIDGKGELNLIQMGRNLTVAIALIGHFAGEAFQGPCIAGCRTFDLIDVGEPARPKQRQSSVVSAPR